MKNLKLIFMIPAFVAVPCLADSAHKTLHCGYVNPPFGKQLTLDVPLDSSGNAKVTPQNSSQPAADDYPVDVYADVRNGKIFYLSVIQRGDPSNPLQMGAGYGAAIKPPGGARAAQVEAVFRFNGIIDLTGGVFCKVN